MVWRWEALTVTVGRGSQSLPQRSMTAGLSFSRASPSSFFFAHPQIGVAEVRDHCNCLVHKLSVSLNAFSRQRMTWRLSAARFQHNPQTKRTSNTNHCILTVQQPTQKACSLFLQIYSLHHSMPMFSNFEFNADKISWNHH